MARAFGRILSSIWDDQDFLQLDPEAQRLYMFLISQPNLNHSGLLPLTIRRWAAKAWRLTAQQVRQSLTDLDAAGFLVVDEETEEVLVRSFVRRDEVYKQPRVMGAAVSGALEISSRRLRRALIAEMGRLPLDELSDEPTRLRNGAEAPSIREQVMGHIDTLMKAFSEPPSPPSGGGSVPPSPTPYGPPSPGVYDPLPEGGAEVDWGTRAPARDPLPLSPTPSPTPVTTPSATPTARANTHTRADDSSTPPRRTKASAAPSPEFEAFWKAYPRKVAKGAAVRAWHKAIDGGADPQVIIGAAAFYALERKMQDPKFTKHPATWLNDACWHDEPDPTYTPPAGAGGFPAVRTGGHAGSDFGSQAHLDRFEARHAAGGSW